MKETLALVYDTQFIIYTVVALVPNLLIILFAMAKLSHDVRLLKQKNAMLETDIGLLDQSINGLSQEFQGIRHIENRRAAGEAAPAPIPSAPAIGESRPR